MIKKLNQGTMCETNIQRKGYFNVSHTNTIQNYIYSTKHLCEHHPTAIPVSLKKTCMYPLHP